MKYYEIDREQVLEEFNVDITKGLSSSEIEKRKSQYGTNEFEEQKKDSIVKMILHQLADVSTIILLIAAVMSFLLAAREGGGFIEPLVITAIIVMNLTLAITQERSAEKALDALSKLNAPKCHVVRDGSTQEVDTIDLVPGDIIVLQTGDMISADARLIESQELRVDESSLTGESESAEKDSEINLEGKVVLGDQLNMVFSGCMVAGGNGKAVVVATGMETQMGKIAGYLNDTQRLKTPLQARLDKIGKLISFIAILSAFALFMIGMRQGEELWHMVFLGVSLAVAAVPETLSLIVTLSLSHGVKNMVARNALVRKLPAVETLGSTSVICTDKTGTLTQNKMTIKRLWLNGTKPVSETEEFTEEYNIFLKKLAMASNASSEMDSEGELRVIGDATETSIINLLMKKGLNKDDVEKEYPRVREIPFSSKKKIMTTVHEDPNGGYLVLCKGAVDRIPCKKSSPELLMDIKETNAEFAEDALRVIGLASKHIDTLPTDDNLERELEQELTFEGMIGIIDPPREEVADAIRVAKRAGIRTIMITGDHSKTAAAIAKQIGILNHGEKVLTGKELSDMSDDDLVDNVREYSVYARVSPEDKIRIVQAWQEIGEVVAMTGDGVNDAPALNAADVGVAMGIAGTEVAKSASDVVLTDDNFATIVEAVHEGRNVYANIRKTIYFLLTCNISEIIIMLGSQMIGWGVPVTPIMLLLINVIGDGIPGLQLAKERSGKSIMNWDPIGREESFFSDGLLGNIINMVIVFSIVTFAGYYMGRFIPLSAAVPASIEIGTTMTFLILGWTSILHIFNVRTKKSLFSIPITANPALVISSFVMIGIFALMAIIPPVGDVVGLTAMAPIHWVLTIVLSLIPSIFSELRKAGDDFIRKLEYGKRLIRHREDDVY